MSESAKEKAARKRGEVELGPAPELPEPVYEYAIATGEYPDLPADVIEPIRKLEALVEEMKPKRPQKAPVKAKGKR